MNRATRLTANITQEEFNNGYWYADEIKTFAKQIGIANSSKLRKDELEPLIKFYLRTGKVKNSNRKNIVTTGIKDSDIGLTTALPINNYTNNEQTKNFIITEAQKIIPQLTIKSGVWYRINRWRDELITEGKKITYGDLIHQFVILNQTDGKFKKVAVTRYINFLSDYLANEKGATRKQAIKEWNKLKKLDIPKDYKLWKQYNPNKSPNR